MRLRWCTSARGLLSLLAVELATGISTLRAQAPTTRADSVALAIVIYGVAFSNGTRAAYENMIDVVCLQGQQPGVDPPQEVLAALQKDRTLLIRPFSACKQEPLRTAPRNTALVVDLLTGKRGISVSATEPTFQPDGSFTVGTGYYQHGRSSAGWVCKGRRRSDQSWEITSCTMRWIS